MEGGVRINGGSVESGMGISVRIMMRMMMRSVVAVTCRSRLEVHDSCGFFRRPGIDSQSREHLWWIQGSESGKARVKGFAIYLF